MYAASHYGESEKAGVRVMTNVISVLFGALSVVLTFRFFLKMIEAHPRDQVLKSIYGYSDAALAPWGNLFPSTISGDGVLEWNALVAIALYYIASIVAARLIAYYAKPEHRAALRLHITRVIGNCYDTTIALLRATGIYVTQLDSLLASLMHRRASSTNSNSRVFHTHLLNLRNRERIQRIEIRPASLYETDDLIYSRHGNAGHT